MRRYIEKRDFDTGRAETIESVLIESCFVKSEDDHKDEYPYNNDCYCNGGVSGYG